MKFSRSLTAVLTLSIALSVVSAAAAQEATPEPLPHWEYEGEAGPDHWGELDERFAACAAGLEQSPVDIVTPTDPETLPEIEFSYQPSSVTMRNNGHTIQVDYEPGSSITIDGTVYNLVQFHFHHPSEHTIDGVVYPLELHLVHADADGNLAVVGVLIKEGPEENAAFASVFDNLATEEMAPTLISDISVNAADLLPAEHHYFSYSGSLTTPPCSEGVRWSVLVEPVRLSVEQIEAFASIFPYDARPVQPLNDRVVLGG